MRTTITVDENNITLTRKQFSEQLISFLAEQLISFEGAAPQQIRKDVHQLP
jgi:hypothetical protein